MDTNVSGRSLGGGRAARCLIPLFLLLSLIPFSARGTLLGDASGAPSLTWRTDTDHPWTPDTQEVPPGVEVSLRSGEIDGDQSSFLETYITGPGNFKFWWKVSSEPLYDVLQFSVDGEEVASIDGNGDWALHQELIGPGRHILQWKFAKDGTGDGGLDAAWIAAAKLTAAEWKLDCFGPRAYPAMAYDSSRDRVILFGGDTMGAHGDTWAWTEETSWTLLQDSGPPARTNHQMVYDSVRDRMVLFGGQARDGSGLSDTWEFDGTNWLKATYQDGPLPRHKHTMVFDPHLDRVLMMGGTYRTTGSDLGNFADLWSWDGTEWKLLCSESDCGQPAPDRDGPHLLAYDTERQVLVACEGYYVKDPALIDTSRIWEWSDVDGWKLISSEGPRGRVGASFVYDPVSHRCILFGGRLLSDITKPQNDTWEWDGAKWHSTDATAGLEGRDGAGLAYDSASNRLVLFGGSRYGDWASGETWIRRDGVWNLRDGDPLPIGALEGCSFAYDSSRQCLVGFGRYPVAHCWEYKDHRWRNADLPGQPEVRYRPGFAYNSLERKIYLCGGPVSQHIYARDTWTYDGEKWELIPVVGPTGAYDVTMTYDADRDALVLLAETETWEYQQGQWAFRSASGPSADGRAQLSFDPNCSAVVAFSGGRGSFQLFWQWNGTSWTAVENRQIASLWENASGYIPALGAVMSFGGLDRNDENFGLTRIIDCDRVVTDIPNSGPILARQAIIVTDYEGGDNYLIDGFLGIEPLLQRHYGSDVWKLVIPEQPQPSRGDLIVHLLGGETKEHLGWVLDTNENGSVDIADIFAAP